MKHLSASTPYYVDTFRLVLSCATLWLLASEGLCGSVSGKIVDAHGMPLKDARVALHSHTLSMEPKVAISDADGVFMFTDLGTNAYSIIVLPETGQVEPPLLYKPVEVYAHVSELELRPNLRARHAVGELLSSDTSGKVAATMTLVPIDRAIAALVGMINPHILIQVEADADGVYDYGTIVPADYLVSIATHSGRIPSFKVSLSEDGEIKIEKYGRVLLEQNNLKLQIVIGCVGGNQDD